MPESPTGDLHQLLHVSAARPGLGQAEIEAILTQAAATTRRK